MSLKSNCHGVIVFVLFGVVGFLFGNPRFSQASLSQPPVERETQVKLVVREKVNSVSYPFTQPINLKEKEKTIREITKILMHKKDTALKDHFRYLAEKIYGTAFWHVDIDHKILARLVRIESSGDSLAVSRIGALGLTQIRPEIWHQKFPECGENLRNVRDNICYGVQVLKYYKKRSPTLRHALLLYNGCRSSHCQWYVGVITEDE